MLWNVLYSLLSLDFWSVFSIGCHFTFGNQFSYKFGIQPFLSQVQISFLIVIKLTDRIPPNLLNKLHKIVTVVALFINTCLPFNEILFEIQIWLVALEKQFQIQIEKSKMRVCYDNGHSLRVTDWRISAFPDSASWWNCKHWLQSGALGENCQNFSGNACKHQQTWQKSLFSCKQRGRNFK